MTYMMMVNDKYMVSIEHDGSRGGAEHVILDNFDGIQGCQAFAEEDMRTSYFIECLLRCETISLDELKTLSDEYAKRWAEVSRLMTKFDRLSAEVLDLEEKLRNLRSEKYKVRNEWDDAQNNAKAFQELQLGLKSDAE